MTASLGWKRACLKFMSSASSSPLFCSAVSITLVVPDTSGTAQWLGTCNDNTTLHLSSRATSYSYATALPDSSRKWDEMCTAVRLS